MGAAGGTAKVLGLLSVEAAKVWGLPSVGAVQVCAAKVCGLLKWRPAMCIPQSKSTGSC